MRLIPLLLVVIFYFLSCDKNDLPEIPQVPIYEAGDTTNGYAQGFKNGVAFEASGFGRTSDSIGFYSVHLRTYTSFGALRENLVIGSIPEYLGVHEISARSGIDNVSVSYATASDDGDVLEDSYLFDDSTIGNILEVITIDTMAKVLTGTFTVNVKIKDIGLKRNPLNPDKIQFSEIKFSVNIID